MPEVYWDWCGSEVMVMERMDGTPICPGGQAASTPGIDLKQLARAGVEIFFTQVFRDGFFHADMHPGNIFVATDGRTRANTSRSTSASWARCPTTDKSYLAQNFLAFFRRDYRRVATAHIESGWVPPDTRVDELESEIRAVCEPIFDRPLKEISLGRSWCSFSRRRGASTSRSSRSSCCCRRRCSMSRASAASSIPNLDLWVTAKPFLERWMGDQIGWRAFERRLRDEAPFLVTALPVLPRLLHTRLSASASRDRRRAERARHRAARAQSLARGPGGTVGRRDRAASAEVDVAPAPSCRAIVLQVATAA